MFVCLVFVNAEININGHIAKGVQKYNQRTCEYLLQVVIQMPNLYKHFNSHENHARSRLFSLLFPKCRFLKHLGHLRTQSTIQYVIGRPATLPVRGEEVGLGNSCYWPWLLME